MQTGKTLRTSVIVLSVAGLGACATASGPIGVSETEAQLCREWRDSLPSRSRADTDRTIDEIEEAYNVFLDACPALSLPF